MTAEERVQLTLGQFIFRIAVLEDMLEKLNAEKAIKDEPVKQG